MTSHHAAALSSTTWRRSWLVLRRELAVEAASRETLLTVGPYVAVLVLLGGLAFGPRQLILGATAPGLVWLVVLVTAVPLAPTVAVSETTDDAWDLLRALTTPGTLLAGKLGAVWLWLVASWGFATVLTSAMFHATPPAVAVVGGLIGTAGIAAVTVLLGTLLPATSRRPALMAVLLLPAGLPALIAGAQTGTPGIPAGPWLFLLGVFDLLTLTVTWAVYPTLLED